MVISLVGCQTNNLPGWYINNQDISNEYIYAVGESHTLLTAKQNALSYINEQIWTQVDSSYSSKEQYRELNNINLSNTLISNDINTKTARLTFTSVEYPKVENINNTFYVQARIKKDNIINQLKSEIKSAEVLSDSIIKNLQHQDKLQWLIENRDIEYQLKSIYIKNSILTSLDKNSSETIILYPSLLKKIKEVSSEIVIHIIPDKKDIKSAVYLSEKIHDEKISTSNVMNENITHTITMKSDYRKNTMDSTYIITKITELNTNNINGLSLANNEIISNANSLTNFNMAQEGSERHFLEIISSSGIWKALGLLK